MPRYSHTKGCWTSVLDGCLPVDRGQTPLGRVEFLEMSEDLLRTIRLVRVKSAKLRVRNPDHYCQHVLKERWFSLLLTVHASSNARFHTKTSVLKHKALGALGFLFRRARICCANITTQLLGGGEEDVRLGLSSSGGDFRRVGRQDTGRMEMREQLRQVALSCVRTNGMCHIQSSGQSCACWNQLPKQSECQPCSDG